MRLADIEVGKVFRTERSKYIVLEQSELGTKIMSVFEFPSFVYKFGNTNNFNESDINALLKKEEEKLNAEFCGKLISHLISLDTLDGQNEFGSWEGKLRILSFDEARRYNDVITSAMNKHNHLLTDSRAWLCTPWTTRSRDLNDFVMVMDTKKGIISKERSFDRLMLGVYVVCLVDPDFSDLEILEKEDLNGIKKVRFNNYSEYNSEKSNDGGSYGFWTDYSRLENGKWEVSYGTTADFEYCPVCGSFNDHYAEDEDDIYNSGYSCGEFATATSDELIDEINKFEKEHENDDEYFIEYFVI